MLNYKLHKKGRSSRRVEVRAVNIEIHALALIICAVLAFFIWLYIVGISQIPNTPPVADTTPAVSETTAEEPETEAPAEDVTEAPTEEATQAETDGPLAANE